MSEEDLGDESWIDVSEESKKEMDRVGRMEMGAKWKQLLVSGDRDIR